MNTELARRHDLKSDLRFRIGVAYLVTKRLFKNLLDYNKRFPYQDALISENVLTSSESELWNKDDNPSNWILTAGKVQNLRIAVKAINGIEIPANEIFSFWKHIGNPNLAKGYVVGREIREGCIVPTKAGGLCQLSNALYDAALKAGFEVLERHRHTKVIPGSLAEQDRDATVKWNYIDLRFRAPFSFRIEAELSQDKLIVKFKGRSDGNQTPSLRKENIKASVLNDCYSCGNTSCFKHPGSEKTRDRKGITTFICDEYWPEYQEYLNSISTEGDYFIVPGYSKGIPQWQIPSCSTFKKLRFISLKRKIQRKISAGNIFQKSLLADQSYARYISKQIPTEATHLVISQNLLPFIMESGALGGRSFDVLMTRLPLELLQKRLDEAKQRYPESPTLDDFRAPEAVVRSESLALTAARRIITPHREIAAIFNNKSIKLNWFMPVKSERKSTDSKRILFPGSAVGRKGAYEIRQLARELDIELSLAGHAIEKEGFLDGLKISKTAGYNPTAYSLLIYPAWVEHQPRSLLKALSHGIPVICTEACGLDPQEGLHIIRTGDYEALKRELQQHLDRMHGR